MANRVVPLYESIYVEAGYAHFALLQELLRRVPTGVSIKLVYLMEHVVRKLSGRRQALGPGDVLTLLYTFRPGFEGDKADLLAARSLIYIRVLQKEEITEGDDPFPHTRDEIAANRLVAGLSYRDCHALFQAIRAKRTAKAREIVTVFVAMKPRAPDDEPVSHSDEAVIYPRRPPGNMC